MRGNDRRLGMHRRITRRDFLHSSALATLGLTLPLPVLGVPAAADYPPIRTGLRGSHPGSFEVAHALAREGKRFGEDAGPAEPFELVVVGGGLSGLAAAWYYRKLHGPDARILILDNHDDFGGHAKRNEFHQGGAMRLAWGGTVNMEYPLFSDTVNALMRDLGIDIPRLLEGFHFHWGDAQGALQPAVFFDAARFGRDALVRGLRLSREDPRAIAARLGEIPLPEAAREALRRFLGARTDVLAGRSQGERERYVRGTSYRDFLREHFALPDAAIALFSAAPSGYWGVRAENLSVAECLESGLPGRHVLGLAEETVSPQRESPVAMFPDGNSSIARLLVRALIPTSFPDMPGGADPFGIVTARLDYGQLDRDASTVRLRLSSTAVRVANHAGGVTVDYVKDGQLRRATAGAAVLACYNAIVPHLVPELPPAQKAALSQCVRRPMLVVNTLLRNGTSLENLGIKGADLPGSFLQGAVLLTGVDVGDYRPAWKPEDPCVLQCYAAFGAPEPEGLTIVEQHRAARERLLGMAFADFEREVRTVFEGMLAPGGFRAARDILAITVNRWPHGYARDHLDLEDPAWNATPPPNVLGRQRIGNIVIANSDAGADAFTHTAIEQAWRAVGELGAAGSPTAPA